MNAKKQASEVNTVHSDVPVSSAVDDNADLEAENAKDDIERKINDNKGDPPPVRDVGYWWITLVCIVLGIIGPLVYYLESFNVYDGRYFQAVTCLFLILICLKLFTWCKFDVEVTSLIGVIILWCWFFYGVIELGRALITGLPAVAIGMVHIAILGINKYGYTVDTIVKATGANFWVWVTAVVCLILPVNIASRMDAKEGIIFSQLFLITWFVEMLYQALVERNTQVYDLVFKSVPVLRLPLPMSALFVMGLVALRIHSCLGFSKSYAVPNKVKTTPMSLYAGVERMVSREEPPERPETPVHVVRKDARVVVETPVEEKPLLEAPKLEGLQAFNKPIGKPPVSMGLPVPFTLTPRRDVPFPVRQESPVVSEPAGPKRMLVGFNPALLGNFRLNN